MKRKQPIGNRAVKSSKISVVMTDEQYKAVVKWAQGQRLSISESLRRVVLSDVSDICDTEEYIDERKRFYYEMERIANNIKQIERKTHQNIWGMFLSFEEYLNKYDFDSQIYHLIRHINEDNNRRRLYWYIMLLRNKVLEMKEHKRDILNNHFRITTHKEEIIEFIMAENFNENSILL